MILKTTCSLFLLLSAALSLHLLAAVPVPAPAQGAPIQWPLPMLPANAMVYPDLAYVTNGSSSQKLDLYLPKKGRDLPLILYVHGGAFCMGDKRKWIRYELGYLQDGYAMASINYRLSNEAVFPAQIEDCKAAVRWLRAHAAAYRLDPSRFVAWGASAGGDLAAMLGTTGNISAFDVGDNLGYSSRVEGVADFFGPSTSPGCCLPSWSQVPRSRGSSAARSRTISRRRAWPVRSPT